MNPNIKNIVLTGLTSFAILGGAIAGRSQTTVTLNPNQGWQGYMNVFGINPDGTANYGAYQFGSAWGASDLRAIFSGTNYLTLTPCTNVWDPNNNYWVDTNTVPEGVANKWMDASFYVENNNIAGQFVTFTGVCPTNNLVGNFSIVAFVKDFVPNYSANTPATVPLVAGQPFTVSLQTTPGDHVQYGFELQGPDVDPAKLADAGSVVINCDNSYPSLLALTSLSLVEGQNANFTVTTFGDPTLYYQWTFSNSSSSYVLTDGGNVSGAATSSLTISNVSLSDIGTYYVTVTNSLGLAMESATLGVQPLSDQIKTNMLINPGFEDGAFASSATSGWLGFNGVEFQNTNDYYYLSATHVDVHDGTNVLHTYSNGAGSYNGAYQDRPAQPGEVFTGDVWFMTPSLDPILDAGQCYLEVQFRDAGDGVLRDYRSAFIDTNSPMDTWIDLQPTNIFAGDFTTFLGTSPYMVAPPGTAKVRYQITHHADTGGSVYADTCDLRLRETVGTITPNGANVNVSFQTIYGPVYDILYKNSLTDSSWQVLTSVTGDGTVKTVPDPAADARFYIINTQ